MPALAPLSRARSALRLAARAAAACGLALMLLQPSAAAAQQTYVVGSDRGGYLHDRLIELSNLQKHGVRVEIRGRVCYSTCTMFLGLPGACVDPATTFGFHGPSRGGRRLTQEKFDYFSRVMAQYYPAPLQSWFMAEGRNRISGVHKIKGSEIIRMGVPACSTA
ncbi:hypothetical protein [Leisingera sp. ANG-M7]|uniref:hypothetical protein n=1 Tax=Leisingera sp. ANG-M7 TaxID=1577902 RepID=UPI00057CB81C|nr:hypothetical protein [Leisingera sp. ANG-M7]KIC31982.1 hypothetical protein RA26_21835 [Leisingera sp. ANG-M7]